MRILSIHHFHSNKVQRLSLHQQFKKHNICQRAWRNTLLTGKPTPIHASHLRLARSFSRSSEFSRAFGFVAHSGITKRLFPVLQFFSCWFCLHRRRRVHFHATKLFANCFAFAYHHSLYILYIPNGIGTANQNNDSTCFGVLLHIAHSTLDKGVLHDIQSRVTENCGGKSTLGNC